MRHTVRRSPRGVEQAAADGRSALRDKACAAGGGAVATAAPAWPGPGTSRIPPKVPESGADSGP